MIDKPDCLVEVKTCIGFINRLLFRYSHWSNYYVYGGKDKKINCVCLYMLTNYISNKDHYNEVLGRVRTVKSSLWIGTADIKDLYIKEGEHSVPFLKILSDLITRGVMIRLIHAKEPGPNFRKDFDKYPMLAKGLERALCPRVHFKLMIFDMKTAYIGSANLTGAGIGMKGDAMRNFEAGILTTDTLLVEKAIDQFDHVWMGSYCAKCRRKTFCGDRIR